MKVSFEEAAIYFIETALKSELIPIEDRVLVLYQPRGNEYTRYTVRWTSWQALFVANARFATAVSVSMLIAFGIHVSKKMYKLKKRIPKFIRRTINQIKLTLRLPISIDGYLTVFAPPRGPG